MIPNELYKREPVEISKNIEILFGSYYSHVPEVSYDSRLMLHRNEKIEIRYYKFFHFDHRRFWALASVWLDEKPVMIFQNAGREGDDHYRRFITDSDSYGKMVVYLLSLKEEEGEAEFVNPDTDVEGLTSFYGCELDGFFETHSY